MRQILSLLFLLITNISISFAQSQKVSYYFAAHPDDWQLFMGVNAFKDIAAASAGNSKVVLIYTTAGEYNCYNLGVNTPYYLSRQAGANRSVQFCSDIYSPHATWNTSIVSISGATNHNILRSTYKNIVSYYLRLPDGCFERKNTSISKLADHTVRSLEAVDSSTSYRGYEDLVRTVINIIDFESNAGQSEVWINASDWDPLTNLDDHPDHVQTGLLATEAANRIDYANVALFEGYHSCTEASNLAPDEIAMEAGLQSQLSFGLTDNGWESEWDPQDSCGHVDWATRNYFRVYSTAAKAKVSNTGLAINPNPIRNTVNLTYKIMEKGPVSITLFDSYGNLKAILVNENKDIGIYTINYEAGMLPTGNYIIYARSSGNLNTLKFMKL